jgi:hypothetical protein
MFPRSFLLSFFLFHCQQCDQCGVLVHRDCYAVQSAPQGRLWLCDPCRAGFEIPPPCALCPVVGGALKRTTIPGRWCHPLCAGWVDETCLDRSLSDAFLQGLVHGVELISAARLKLTCKVCGQRHGACIQCSHPSCYAPFHATCGRQAQGYIMKVMLGTKLIIAGFQVHICC